MRIEDASGNLVGVYSASGIVGSPFAPTGSAAGVWVRSRPRFDDFYAVEHRELDAYPASLSLSAGGEQTLDLTFGSSHAGEIYVVAGSLTGSSPPTLVGSVPVPLVFDVYTAYTLTGGTDPPLTDWVGTLDALGHARAALTVPPGSFPAFAGLTLHHAAVAVDLATGPTTATNAATVTLTP